MKDENGIDFSQSYVTLPKDMYSFIKPKYNKIKELVLLNKEVANQLNIDIEYLQSQEGLQLLSGNTDIYGPLFAQAYAGHQYGYFTMLGDGRAIIIGEQVGRDNQLYDIQLKGSGVTPYSRRGDGRATLYSMLREYLISESMHSLEIPTTRMLSIIETKDRIQRQGLKKSAILSRVALSHIRVGTFEYTFSQLGTKGVKELADYVIDRHFAEIKEDTFKYQEMLHQVIKRQAKLIAKWQSVGFVHGVMNTDNMTVSGETIDYGPCAFLDQYDPNQVYSSIDQNGRYAYKKQPFIASWNLSKLAQTLLELLDGDHKKAVDKANVELRKFESYYYDEYYKIMARKIGIIDSTKEDETLIDDLLSIMELHKADYTNTFVAITRDRYHDLPFYKTDEWEDWFQRWTRTLGYRQMDVKQRISLMESVNPIIIPRNFVVEDALMMASENNDYTLFDQLLSKLKDPYNYRTTHEETFLNPKNQGSRYITYCGT